jgi:hypothetical protein
VLAGKLAGSLATSTSAFVQNRVAAQAKLVADKAVAASTLTAAKTQAAYAVQLQQGAQRQLFAAKSDAARSTAITNLALRNGQLLTAQNAVTAATVRYTAAARTASVASRALSGSMAFLGGPIGIITTAAIAVSFFSSAANDAEVPTDELTASVKGLTEGYKQLTQTQLKARGVRLDDQLNTVNERVSAITANIANLRTEARDGIRISVGVQAPVSVARKKEINDDILLQEAELERLEQSKNTLLETQLEIKERIASGAGPDNAPDTQSAGLVTPEVDYSKQLAKLDVSLQTEKERVQASFDAKEKILIESLDRNLLTQNAFDVRHMQIQLERDTALREIKQDAEKEQLELSRERREKELRDIEERYEQELRLLQGFASRKEQVEFELEERVFAFKTRKTGQMQGVLGNFSNWQKRDEADKVNAVVGLGEFGFKQFAGQSKKAFAAYKAFSIAKAVINTYEMATGAFNALAPIPVVGPILGAAAAASAVAFGLAQVNTIRGQQFSAAYHGGRDYIPEEQTVLVQKGERVVSPKQNVELTAAAEKINKGQFGGGNVYLTVQNTYEISDTSEGAIERLEAIQTQAEKRIEAMLVNQLRTGQGAFYNAVRAA